MSNFLLIFLCVVAGLLLRRIPAFPENVHVGLNAFIIYVSLPAISLRYIPALDLSAEMLLPFLSGLIVMGGALLFFWLLQFIFRWPAATLGALMLVCGLGNTSFVGFPVTEALYGAAGLQFAIFADQAAFLMLSFVGISVAAAYSGQRLSLMQLGRRVVSFPPFIAFLLALGLAAGGWQAPEALDTVLAQLGGTLTPLALFSVGYQLRLQTRDLSWSAFGLGLGYKLLLAPLLVWAIFAAFTAPDTLPVQVAVLESGMPPMVTASIVATQYRLNPPLANLLVGLGLVAAVPSLYLWWQVL